MKTEFLSELTENYKTIYSVYKQISDQEDSVGGRIATASEWLLDNFYIIERQTREIELQFDKKAEKRLPPADGGKLRIYEVAKTVVQQAAGKIDEEFITSEIGKLQEDMTLSTAELWSLPLMLRAGILSQISKICRRTLQTQKAYRKAAEAAKSLEQGMPVEKLRTELTDKNSSSFVEYLVYCLKQKGGKNFSILTEIDAVLSDADESIEQLVAAEYERQASRQMKMGNLIGSLTAISTMDWIRFFQQISKVEEVLQSDPSGVYPHMDFETKDYYRGKVVEISEKYHQPDIAMAQLAVRLCEGRDGVEGHVGYYLIGEGKKELIRQCKGSAPADFSPALYAGIIAAVSVLGAAAFYVLTHRLFLSLLSLLPLSQIVIGVMNFWVSHQVPAAKLPRLELSELPPTLVVIPTLLTDQKRALEMLDNLEVFYLSNREENLSFALAGDFRDGPREDDEEDQGIVQAAVNRVEELNRKYGKEIFYYFNRKRSWNQKQQRWMGYERKRGALMELNRLLLGDDSTGYTVATGRPQAVKYVITLDADTRLPMGGAKKLVECMEHPLNHPVVDKKRKVVTRGYGILQPQVGVDIESANKTTFARIFAGQGGIDPYSTVCSDIYQDLFGESIFTGKGIYRLEVLEEVLDGRLPENQVLSHDLLEGSYVRCGLAGDVELIDGFPAKYNSYAKRHHRWLRGDWQLLPWLFPKVKDAAGNTVENPLNFLSRWKIFDNLRRSMLPVAHFLMLLPFAGGFSLIALLSLLFPVLAQLFDDFLQKTYRNIKTKSYVTIVRGVGGAAAQSFMLIMLLPYEAYLALDAAIRALYRTLGSGKNSLEWVTAADSEKAQKNSVRAYYGMMAVNVAAGLFAAWLAPWVGAWLLWGILLGALWVISPYLAYLTGMPFEVRKSHASREEILYLRKLARKTWRYFEDFMRPEHGLIPPDNFQENPPNGTADRASPTNIGISMLAVLAAYDFGYITKRRLCDLLKQLLDTIDSLEKWNGHLYNWYDTKTLRILPPAYVSTVDSGNLAGFLIALSQGLEKIKEEPAVTPRILEGLRDTARLLAREGYEVNLSPLEGDNWKHGAAAVLAQLEEYKGRSAWMNPLAQQLKDLVEAQSREVSGEEILQLAQRAGALAEAMDFKPLYAENRGLFYIGYDVSEGKPSGSYYDLLASEARQASFVAIAKGDVPVRHWFRLGRALAVKDGYKGLASWSGTMFEYFMPRLLMKNIPNTLMDETYHFVMAAQWDYGKKRNVPWGVSEAAFAAFDMKLNYQYKAFGIPELGFKRGLGEDTVIAPYASVLGLMSAPAAAVRNLRRIHELGGEGLYGFYESIDYTPGRQLRGKDYTVVKTYMVHHLGMSLLSLDNVLHSQVMQERFHSAPMVKGVEYLLQERVPVYAGIISGNRKTKPIRRQQGGFDICVREAGPTASVPAVQLLSNSTFCSLIDQNGCGYMKSGSDMVTRFRRCDDGLYGMFVYLRNCGDGKIWSAAPEPMGKGIRFKTFFHSHKAEIIGENDGIAHIYETAVSPEDSLEVRRLRLKNNTGKPVTLEVTSYLEPVLGKLEDDIAHSAFGKLFISTEYSESHRALLARRGPREDGGKEKWMFHKLAFAGGAVSEISFDTKRSNFIGRGRDLSHPAAMDDSMPLAGEAGAPIDPALALRCRISVAAGKTAALYYVTGAAADRFEALNLCAKYEQTGIAENVFEVALTRSRVVNQFLHITAEDEAFILNLLGLMIYPSNIKHKWQKRTAENRLTQEGLWKHGISGDLPLLVYLTREKDSDEELGLLLKAHEYWRLRGYASDLVIIARDADLYNSPASGRVMETVAASPAREHLDRPGGVFIRKYSALSEEEMTLLLAVARVILEADAPLAQQLQTAPFLHRLALPQTKPFGGQTPRVELPKLEFENGLGGFDMEKREYVISTENGRATPMPWVNVVANPRFGFLASENGGGYTWFDNSRENKLTPWTNDFVTDAPGECIFLQDAENRLWSATKGPIDTGGQYVTRHGFGYTVYQHRGNGFDLEQTVFADAAAPVKYQRLKVKNRRGREQRLRLIYMVRPVLGVSESHTLPHIVSAYEEGCLFARSSYPNGWDSTLYLACDHAVEEAVHNEGQLRGVFLQDGTRQDGLPVLALTTTLVLAPQAEETVCFSLGTDREAVKRLAAEQALEETKAYWNGLLTAIQVKTPDRSMDILANGRLLYQNYCCRMLAKSGFYQSSGATGFRDQLQDSMAMLYVLPEVTRRQILLHAQRQFAEGDVQHWWHDNPLSKEAPSRGIRTKFSDDLVWLVYVTAEYLEKTGDFAVLDTELGYLQEEPLPEDVSERYGVPGLAEEKGSLYQHCKRALARALRYGGHGLPLMGSGDWNDGMNTVGDKGKGESVWLAFFLIETLKKFIPVCENRGDSEAAEDYRKQMKKLSQAAEAAAWDGDWYRRAYFDDGTPLGSAENSECKIDSISQSWSVISGAAPQARARSAMENLEKYLIDYEHGIARLLAPPFEGKDCHPGYISSYLPGVRENGGQYTHAAVWVIMAYALMGDGQRAANIFHMINPINHTNTPLEVNIYKTEPYAMAADVYYGSGNTGRGGWTWYTGAAGWMQRVCVEYILGLRKFADHLELRPSVPPGWEEFSITYRWKEAIYEISVKNPDKKSAGLCSAVMDGTPCDNGRIPLLENGTHQVEAKI